MGVPPRQRGRGGRGPHRRRRGRAPALRAHGERRIRSRCAPAELDVSRARRPPNHLSPVGHYLARPTLRMASVPRGRLAPRRNRDTKEHARGGHAQPLRRTFRQGQSAGVLAGHREPPRAEGLLCEGRAPDRRRFLPREAGASGAADRAASEPTRPRRREPPGSREIGGPISPHENRTSRAASSFPPRSNFRTSPSPRSPDYCQCPARRA